MHVQARYAYIARVYALKQRPAYCTISGHASTVAVPCWLCRSGSRNTSHRLHAFADCLRLVFNSNEAAAEGLPPAHLGYKVHVRMEKSKVPLCLTQPVCLVFIAQVLPQAVGFDKLLHAALASCLGVMRHVLTCCSCQCRAIWHFEKAAATRLE